MALTTWTSTEAGQITLGDYRASDHRASEVSGERERYAFGGGFLPRPHHRHQRDRDRRRGGHKHTEEGEAGKKEARRLEDHDDEALRMGRGRDVAE